MTSVDTIEWRWLQLEKCGTVIFGTDTSAKDRFLSESRLGHALQISLGSVLHGGPGVGADAVGPARGPARRVHQADVRRTEPENPAAAAPLPGETVGPRSQQSRPGLMRTTPFAFLFLMEIMPSLKCADFWLSGEREEEAPADLSDVDVPEDRWRRH